MSEMANENSEPCDEIIMQREGALHTFVLNRPRALNALNDAMKNAIAAAIPGLARDIDLYAVVYRSSPARAFCAGGDVRELVALAREDMALARASLASEYSLYWLLDCFSKPSLAILDGAVMGSGVGLTQVCTHRLATENHRFAMPETALGFFPDVGMAHVLARLTNHVGMYLALSGHSIGRADALRLGLVTHCIASEEVPAIQAALADAYPIDPLLDTRHQDPGAGVLGAQEGHIAEAFGAPTVEEILARLDHLADRHAGNEWLQTTRQDLAKRSPTALKVTHSYLRKCRDWDLRENLIVDYRLACKFLESHDFYEGVRAVLLAKDGAPKWRPDTVAAIADATVEAYFAPLSDGELELASRAQMQAARV